MTNERLTLASRIKTARQVAGPSVQDAARHLNMPAKSFSALELGERGVSALELKRLAALYKVSPSALLGVDGEDNTLETACHSFADLTTYEWQALRKYADYLKLTREN